MRKWLFGLLLLLWALPAHAVVDGSCNYTAGTTSTATAFSNCTAELMELYKRAARNTSSVAGTNTITATTTPTLTAYADGLAVWLTPAITNSGTTTLNLDSVGAKNVANNAGTNLGSGELIAGTRYLLVFDSTNDKWLVAGGAGSGGGASTALAYVTVGNTASLSAERAITAGTNISVTDGGANSTATIAVSDGELNAIAALGTGIPAITGSGTASARTVTAGTGVAVTNGDGVSGNPTVAFDYSDAGASPSLGADECRFTSNATSSGFIVCEGDTANAFETRIFVTDPTADRLFTIPNADSVAVQPLTCGGTDKVSGISSLGVITCTTDGGGGGSGDNITINASAASDANFGTLPAAVSGINVVWQLDTATTPDNVSAYVPAGTTSAAGALELATTAEAEAMTDTARAVTPEGLKYKRESFCVAASDETTQLTAGTAKVTFRMPYAFTLTSVRASINTVSTSGTPTFDLNEGGVSVFSTPLTIDVGELTTTTAAVASVISDTSLADDASITIDIDTAGTGSRGLKICLIGHQT
jgi:hypothetical protein